MPRRVRGQYADRRARGAEFHLAEIYGFWKKSVRGERYVYLASLDKEGAFDAATHYRILSAVSGLRITGPFCKKLADLEISPAT